MRRRPERRAREKVQMLLSTKLKTIAVSVATSTAMENPRRVVCATGPSTLDASRNAAAFTITPSPPTTQYLTSVRQVRGHPFVLVVVV